MTCIKMGSDESRFNVSLIVRDKVTRQCPQTTTFQEKGELKLYRTESFRLPAYRLTARPNRLSRRRRNRRKKNKRRKKEKKEKTEEEEEMTALIMSVTRSVPAEVADAGHADIC